MDSNLTVAPSPRVDEPADYRRFWERVGEDFPDLGGAQTTSSYFEDERVLFEQHLPSLEGLKIFKTDLWDEARNQAALAVPNLASATGAGRNLVSEDCPSARSADAESPPKSSEVSTDEKAHVEEEEGEREQPIDLRNRRLQRDMNVLAQEMEDAGKRWTRGSLAFHLSKRDEYSDLDPASIERVTKKPKVTKKS